MGLELNAHGNITREPRVGGKSGSCLEWFEDPVCKGVWTYSMGKKRHGLQDFELS